MQLTPEEPWPRGDIHPGFSRAAVELNLKVVSLPSQAKSKNKSVVCQGQRYPLIEIKEHTHQMTQTKEKTEYTCKLCNVLTNVTPINLIF